MKVPKTKRHECPEFLAWIKTFRCLVVGCDNPVSPDPHHLQTRGSGGSDYSVINLCRTHHTECHNSRIKFEQKYALNLYQEAFSNLMRWLEKENVI